MSYELKKDCGVIPHYDDNDKNNDNILKGKTYKKGEIFSIQNTYEHTIDMINSNKEVITLVRGDFNSYFKKIEIKENILIIIWTYLFGFIKFIFIVIPFTVIASSIWFCIWSLYKMGIMSKEKYDTHTRK